MPDNTQATTVQNDLNIPEDTKSQFSDLITMIQSSRSMNDEEKQYWIDVLPIMTEEQIVNLQEILDNEKKQIEEAKAKRDKSASEAVTKAARAFDAEAYKEKKKLRLEEEERHEEEERKNEKALLAELENL